MTRADRLTHLTGYAAIAAVLASGEWAGPLGSVVGWLFALAVAILLLRAAHDHYLGHVREQAEDAAETVVNGDGGEPADA